MLSDSFLGHLKNICLPLLLLLLLLPMSRSNYQSSILVISRLMGFNRIVSK